MWAYQRVARRGDWHSVHLQPHPSLTNKEKHTDGGSSPLLGFYDLLPMLERIECLTMIKEPGELRRHSLFQPAAAAES
nr:PREDICTED: uncharacterized protein LOC103982705 isoform X2 [Musa acuminata subsp. malaccensis]